MTSNAKDDFNRLRAQFSRRANSREVSALASKLCWWIVFGRMDTKRRSTFVTQKTLADDLGGVTVRTVQRMIDVLKPLGLNVAPGHGPDMASTYWIGEANTTSMSPIEPANTTPMSPIQPGQGDTQGDTGVSPRRHFKRRKATLVSRHIKKSKKISKKVSNKKERGSAARSADDVREGTSSSTVDDAPVPQPLAPDEVASLIRQPNQQKQNPPSSASKNIGRPAANGAGAEASPFAKVLDLYPADCVSNEPKAFSAFIRAVNALGNLDAVLGALDRLMQETGPGFPDLADAMVMIIERDHHQRTGARS